MTELGGDAFCDILVGGGRVRLLDEMEVVSEGPALDCGPDGGVGNAPRTEFGDGIEY